MDTGEGGEGDDDEAEKSRKEDLLLASPVKDNSDNRKNLSVSFSKSEEFALNSAIVLCSSPEGKMLTQSVSATEGKPAEAKAADVTSEAGAKPSQKKQNPGKKARARLRREAEVTKNSQKPVSQTVAGGSNNSPLTSTPKANDKIRTSTTVTQGTGKKSGKGKGQADAKRKRSDQSTPDTNPPNKKQDVRTKKSFSETVKSSLQIFITKVDGSLNKEEEILLRNNLCERLDQTPPDVNRPTFDYFSLINGSLRAQCTNTESATWLKTQISEIDSINGAKLISSSKEDKRKRVTISIREKSSDSNEKILSRIQHSNQQIGLSTGKWIVTKVLKLESDYRLLLVAIDEDSVKIISERTDGSLYYQLQKFTIDVKMKKPSTVTSSVTQGTEMEQSDSTNVPQGTQMDH